MGAYGAALFSLVRGDGPSIAFGPKMQLGLEGSHSSRYGIDYDDRYSVLYPLLARGSDFPVNVWFGSADCVDAFYWANSIYCAGPNVKIKLMNSCHALHQHMYNLAEVPDIIKSLVEGRPLRSGLEINDFDVDLIEGKKKNYSLWRSFLKKESVDFFNYIEFDFGDIFYKSRIAQKYGHHEFAIEKITQVLSYIDSSQLLKALPEVYVLGFIFLRAESKRRFDGGGKEDYLLLYNSGFRKEFCSRFI